jgi:hypothetical protein
MFDDMFNKTGFFGEDISDQKAITVTASPKDRRDGYVIANAVWQSRILSKKRTYCTN